MSDKPWDNYESDALMEFVEGFNSKELENINPSNFVEAFNDFGKRKVKYFAWPRGIASIAAKCVDTQSSWSRTLSPDQKKKLKTVNRILVSDVRTKQAAKKGNTKSENTTDQSEMIKSLDERLKVLEDFILEKYGKKL